MTTTEVNGYKIEPCADLRGTDLRYADLSGACLRYADLSGSCLRYADLIGTNLIGTNLIGTNLIGTNLIGASLIGASLSGANLSGANLSGANLSGVNLSGANLSGTNLSGANLSGTNLSGANLSGANLWGVTGNMREVISAQFETWPVTAAKLLDNSIVVQIGCQRHDLKLWRKADPRWIDKMDFGATGWWTRWGDLVLMMVDRHFVVTLEDTK